LRNLNPIGALVSKNDQRPSQGRRYPERYEKVVPIALGVILAAVVVLLIVAVAIALGLFSGK
jgi:hypothetical protein